MGGSICPVELLLETGKKFNTNRVLVSRHYKNEEKNID
jgi:hypothetical protein